MGQDEGEDGEETDMMVTMISAGVIGLLLVGLAFRVSLLRRAGGVSLGDGGNPRLLAAVRAHANCTEWAPIGLILLALAERSVGPVWYVTALAVLFVGARLLHPLGMASPTPHPARAAGALLTYATVAALAVLVIVRALPHCATCGAA